MTASKNIDNYWSMKEIDGDPIQIGFARDITHLFYQQAALNWALMRGMVKVNNALQFSPEPFGADFSLACVAPTEGSAFCGDRTMAEIVRKYEQIVAQPIAQRNVIGDVLHEDFSAAGAAEYGKTLAHVMVGHMPRNMMQSLHDGHPDSFALYAVTRGGHTGELEIDGARRYGITKEAHFLDERAACGAVVGTLAHFNSQNPDHVRIRDMLGEDNYLLLTQQGIRSVEGIDITAPVASAIVAVQGMYETNDQFRAEMNQRDVAHTQAHLYIHRTGRDDLGMLLARSIIHDGQARIQGLGTDARLYNGELILHKSQYRLQLSYSG